MGNISSGCCGSCNGSYVLCDPLSMNFVSPWWEYLLLYIALGTCVLCGIYILSLIFKPRYDEAED